MSFKTHSPSKTKKLKRKTSDKFSDYSTSPYSSSLPSPPYSEENSYSSLDEKESNDDETSLNIDMRNGGITYNNTKDSKKGSQNDSNLTFWNVKQFERSTYSRLPSPHLSSIYPNLMKGVASITDSVSPPKKKPKRSNTRKGYLPKKRSKVNCNVCHDLVKPSDIEKHLFFGSFTCSDCGWTKDYCSIFNILQTKSDFVGGCQHSNLKWTSNPVSNLKKWLECDVKEVSEERFKKVLHEYIQLLQPLKDIYPWSKAIAICNKYITSPTWGDQTTKLASSENDSLKSVIKEEKKEIAPIENINLPNDGNYLILKEAIEECPNCYEVLDIRRLTFNVETWLINVICKECRLNIYFVLDPPDGSAPRIRILMDD